MTVLGLLLDIVGVYLLAHVIFLRKVNQTVDVGFRLDESNAERYYGAKDIHAALSENRMTRIGLVFVIVGFALQIISNFDNDASVHAVEVVLVIIFICTIFWLITDMHFRETFAVAVELLDRMRSRKFQDNGGTNPKDVIDCVRYGKPQYQRHCSFFNQINEAQRRRCELRSK